MKTEATTKDCWREAFLGALAAQQRIPGLRIVSAEEMAMKLRGSRMFNRAPVHGVRVWMAAGSLAPSSARRIMMDVYVEGRGSERGLLMNTEVFGRGSKALSGWNTLPRDLHGTSFNAVAHAQNLLESLQRHAHE